MIEQAIVLSAGQGSRLLPVTATIPKCLIEVGGQTLLERQLAALAAAGLKRALVVTGYRHEQVDEALRQPLPLEVETRFNPFWGVASSIGSVWIARDRLQAPFCLLNGDTLFDPQIVAAALMSRGAGLGLVVEPIAAASYDDMLVRAVDGAVRKVSKALPEGEATHRSLGLVLAAQGYAEYARELQALIAERNGAGAYHHDILDRLARRLPVAAIERSAGFWQEVDRPEDIAVWRAEHEPGFEG
ncbi:MAG: phosphocholine cytidylyltransferase family protein [Croceibacterium sp.]